MASFIQYQYGSMAVYHLFRLPHFHTSTRTDRRCDVVVVLQLHSTPQLRSASHVHHVVSNLSHTFQPISLDYARPYSQLFDSPSSKCSYRSAACHSLTSFSFDMATDPPTGFSTGRLDISAHTEPRSPMSSTSSCCCCSLTCCDSTTPPLLCLVCQAWSAIKLPSMPAGCLSTWTIPPCSIRACHMQWAA